MKKRVICLVLLLVIFCIPFIACESNTKTQTNSQGLEFNRLSDGTYEVSFYNGKDTHVIIPKEYNGKPVTRIGSEAFGLCANVISITIPEGITSIGYNAFVSCINLASITIPDSVTKIEESAFRFCYNLTKITIPDSIIIIENYAFDSSPKLTICCEAQIKPYGWQDKWNYLNRPVIWNCKNNNTSEAGYEYVTKNGINYALDEGFAKVVGTDVSGDVVLPSNITYNSKTYPVTTIEEKAFYYCRKMLSIKIPSSVTTIAENAFDTCTHLTIYCEADSKQSGWSDNWNISNCPVVWNCKNNKIADDGYEYKINKNGIHYAVNSSTAKVVLGEVSGKVVIPSSITHNSKTYPVTKIGNSAFGNCSNLTSIKIPSSVTSIGSTAFYNCYNLTKITIPESVTSIDDYAFEWCDKLVIYCEAKSKPSEWSGYWNSLYCPVVWDCKNNNTLIDSDSVTWEYGITVNGINYAVNESGAKAIESNASGKVVIPSSITHNSKTYPVVCIGYKAFYNCFDLTSITIPESVTTIERYAFSNCVGLTSITIPKSITSIEKYTFISCSNLTNVTIPESVTSIGEYAFSSCISLTNVTIPKNVTTIENNAFRNCDSLSSIIIPNSVERVGERIFSYCYNITIYCEAESEPMGWDYYWNYESWSSSTYPVVWGHKANP